MNKYLVYKVTNLKNLKSYIGITNNLIKRKRLHIFESTKRNSSFVFHKAIRKYGESNFNWMIIKNNLSFELAKKLEKFYIKKYNTFINYGYNMTEGGDGVFGYKFTLEQRKRLSESHKGYKHSKETINKMRLVKLGKKNSKKHNKNISNSFSKNWLVNLNGKSIKVFNLKQYSKKVKIPYTTLIRKSVRIVG